MCLKTRYSQYDFEAGTDEAGRGCLAGPVTAAAVILPRDYFNNQLNDSKKLSAKKRHVLRNEIENNAISFGVSFIDNYEIDLLNIANASILCMQDALDKLKVAPDFVIIDGNYFKPYRNIPYQTIVKGDAKFLSIAAASILAKTYRDEFMNQIADKYPKYGWQKNMGYPTLQHRQAIREFGATEYHRKSFRLLPDPELPLNW
ncbi:ribonuclease HII [Flavobacterium aurantiibacter]|uniref:Ribonuclease HII n=1 Tax=Flavobacterium aurantiibacter TaxID=2023067 RepID=A0A255ZP36_9FLAO|nr:ribonuclease HII [Flavobacterium aurantiibacter]OYQ43181.1 ribonuclease HII [Flavobacterium aurantiibacter]